MSRKQKDSMTTEELAEKAIKDLQEMSPEEKAEVRRHLDRELSPKIIRDQWNPEEKVAARAALRKKADLSSLAGRAGHLRGLAFAAHLVKSEEECFREVMDFFEKLKTEDVKYKM